MFDLMTFNYHVAWPGIWPAIVFMAIVGVPIAGMVAGLTTLMQSATEDAYRGRILGAFGAVGALSTFLGALLGGLLGDKVGIVTMLNIQGLGYGSLLTTEAQVDSGSNSLLQGLNGSCAIA